MGRRPYLLHRSVDNKEEQEITSRRLQKSQHQPVSDLAKSKRASRLVKVNKQSPSTLTTKSDCENTQVLREAITEDDDATTNISYRKQGGDNPANYSDSLEFLQTNLYY